MPIGKREMQEQERFVTDTTQVEHFTVDCMCSTTGKLSSTSGLSSETKAYDVTSDTRVQTTTVYTCAIVCNTDNTHRVRSIFIWDINTLRSCDKGGLNSFGHMSRKVKLQIFILNIF